MASRAWADLDADGEVGQSLLHAPENPDHSEASVISSSPSALTAALAFLLLVASVLLGLSSIDTSHAPMGEQRTSMAQDGMGGLKNMFSATNKYNRKQTTSPGKLYPWLRNHQLVEPYHETVLEIRSPEADHDYVWVITPKSPQGSTSVTLTGSQVTHEFTQLGEHSIVIRESDGSRGLVAVWEDKVISKYVRREIRTLDDTDREQLLDAMVVLWTVPMKEGQRLYGPGYVDITAIALLHTTAGNDPTCDRFHDGLGFLVSHSILTNILEQSLQLVNPKLTIPYWDYTIEAAHIETQFGGNYLFLEEASPMFTAAYFGSTDKETLAVQDGRWGNFSMPMVDGRDQLGVEPNVYGFLRSPWNTNGRPFLTRGLGNSCGFIDDEAGGTADRLLWPNCEEHYNLQMNFNDFYSWVWYGSYRPHGPVHLWIGGTNDCAPMYKEIENLLGTRAASALKSFAFILRRTMMRGGWWSCSGSAPMDVPSEELASQGYCGCSFDLNDEKQLDAFYQDVSMGTMAAIMRFQDLDTKRKVANLLCTGDMSLGEQTQSSSVLDPTFWPIHPTMERLFMMKRLGGSMEDLWWPNSTVVKEVDGQEYEYIISWQDADCQGHRPFDVFPYGLPQSFKAKLNLFNTLSVNTYTNAEFLTMLDPRVDVLPYVYDTFDWPHCTEQGFNMDDVWGIGAEASATQAQRDLYEAGPSPKLMVGL